MNTGYKIRNIIKRIENGIVVQQYDYTSNPSLTAIQLANDTGMSLARATQLINERRVLDTIDCPLPLLGQIQFVKTSYSIQEPNIGVAILTIELERLSGCDENITATVDVVGGTALPLNDFTNIFPVTVTWLDGDCTNKTIDIPIVGDTLDEVDETIILEITNLTAGSLGINTQTTITIVDNDTIYNVNVINSNTSTCTVTGVPIYPYTQQVNQNQSITLPINTSCTISSILINGINQPSNVITQANTGSLTLSNIQENKTIELIYGTQNVLLANILGYGFVIQSSPTIEYVSEITSYNSRVYFKFKDAISPTLPNGYSVFDNTITASTRGQFITTLKQLFDNDSRLINNGYFTSLNNVNPSTLDSYNVQLIAPTPNTFFDEFTFDTDYIQNNNVMFFNELRYNLNRTYKTNITAKKIQPILVNGIPVTNGILNNVYY